MMGILLLSEDRSTVLPPCNGPVVRASASESEGRGFEPRPSHTKDFKNGTHCFLVWRSIKEKGVGKLNMRSYQWTSPPL